MPLPAGFKINGSKVSNTHRIPVPPRVKKIMALLDKVPANELLTTGELSGRIGLILSGGAVQFPALSDYREKIDNKLFWGNRKSIAKLRKQLSSMRHIND